MSSSQQQRQQNMARFQCVQVNNKGMNTWQNPKYVQFKKKDTRILRNTTCAQQRHLKI